MADTPAQDLGSLSDDDLMSEWSALGERVQSDRERLKAFSAEHQRRTTQAHLADVLGPLSDADRRALAQYAEASGAESQEGVGNP